MRGRVGGRLVAVNIYVNAATVEDNPRDRGPSTASVAMVTFARSSYAMLGIIIAPPSAPQIVIKPQAPPPPGLLLDRLDQQIVAEFQRHGRYGTRIWTVLNQMARNVAPDNRDDLRHIKLALEQRLRWLLKAGLLFRFNRKFVTAFKFNRERTVRRKQRLDAGSAVTQASETGTAPATIQLKMNVLGQADTPPPSSPAPPKTKSAPDPAQAAEAGRALAQLPRNQPRKWTGWLHGIHCWRDRRVVLPNGEVTELAANGLFNDAKCVLACIQTRLRLSFDRIIRRWFLGL